ncbi:hypothetical protein PoB_005974500 [Plakobranchus ocellatus]|uniref:Uncharacterized protein n=1 Tax=Plakobranchus ocellatus TaxID=259542 RepID=A0AAV4CMT4_9GAST|nr:hypothetical protein PoB_005974500 [Plakobranchus ocellatus]
MRSQGIASDNELLEVVADYFCDSKRFQDEGDDDSSEEDELAQERTMAQAKLSQLLPAADPDQSRLPDEPSSEEVHAIMLPGRMPYQWKDDVKLLPTNCSKKVVYDAYENAAKSMSAGDPKMMYPCDPLQPGPIYFKIPRKCALFGICCEAFSSQINFLIDESVDVGKGVNAVVSMIHFFFEHYGLGETEVHLHADNC